MNVKTVRGVSIINGDETEPQREKELFKDFPEYTRFITNDTSKVPITVLLPDDDHVNVEFERIVKEGGLGDVIESYVELVLEEKNSKELFSSLSLKKKRSRADRRYLIKKLRNALNNVSIEWTDA